MLYNMSCYFMVYNMSFLCYITCYVHVMLYLLYNMYCFVTLYNILFFCYVINILSYVI